MREKRGKEGKERNEKEKKRKEREERKDHDIDGEERAFQDSMVGGGHLFSCVQPQVRPNWAHDCA
jgi:hypothetical protein